MPLPQEYCLVRKQWVPALPEERVRQHILNWMTTELGYPIALLAVEKSLKQMPHLSLQEMSLPERRADLICFGKDIHPEHGLYPLLLIECKAHRLTSQCVEQVMGYNHLVQAYFVAVANGEEIKTAFYKHGQFNAGLPAYSSLMEFVKKKPSKKNSKKSPQVS
jgi:hypothetical protein